MADQWHVGRQAIIQYFYSIGFLRSNHWSAWRTIQHWKKKGSIIIRHDDNNRPFIIESEVKSRKFKVSEKILSK